MELEKSYYNGKELYYGYPCGYRCYFHKNFVIKGSARVDNDDCYEEYYTVYKVQFPIIGCDIVEINDALAVIPGSHNLFGFSCDGEIREIEIDNAIKIFKSKENDCALILTDQDKIKIKWNDKYGQWVSVRSKSGIKEQIASEELLKYL